jgi:hypothetical protein
VNDVADVYLETENVGMASGRVRFTTGTLYVETNRTDKVMAPVRVPAGRVKHGCVSLRLR